MSDPQHTTQADAAVTYKIKRVRDREGQLFQIVNQSLNGPCPLLAIVNVLLLRGNILLPQSSPDVSEVRMAVAVYLHSTCLKQQTLRLMQLVKFFLIADFAIVMASGRQNCGSIVYQHRVPSAQDVKGRELVVCAPFLLKLVV